MPTDESLQELPERSINVLLNLGTYQGMTDEEIERVIEWHKTQALLEATNAAELNAHSAAMNEIVEGNAAAMESLIAMVQSIVNSTVELGVIADGTA